jgi:hypothetical protein
VGQVTDILDKFFVFLVPYFVEQYRQQDRRRKTPKKTVKADEEGITDQLPEIRLKEKFVEMFKTNPGATHNPLHDVEVLESQHDSVQGGIVEDKVIHKGQGKDYIQPGTFFDSSENLRLFSHSFHPPAPVIGILAATLSRPTCIPII